MISRKEWHTKKRSEFTLEDCMDAMHEGFHSICADRKIMVVTYWPDKY